MNLIDKIFITFEFIRIVRYIYIFKYLTLKHVKTKINDSQNILRNDGSSLVDIVILTIKRFDN